MLNEAKQVIHSLGCEAWSHTKALPKLAMMLYDLWASRKQRVIYHEITTLQSVIRPGQAHNTFSTDAAHKLYTPKQSDQGPIVIYVNGIWTNLEQAKMETDILANSELSQYISPSNYALLYNASRGINHDLFDAFAARVWRRRSNVVVGLRQYLRHLYNTNAHRTVILVGYSQGGIIVSQALNSLDDHIRDDMQFVCLTVGGAQSSLKPFNGQAHHIAHENDYVAYTGVITHHKRGQIFGDLHTYDGQSHLFPKYVDQLNNVVRQRSHDIGTLLTNDD